MFAAMDTDGSGLVSYTEFIKAFGASDTPESRDLFHLIDVDDTGTIDFKEFLTGLALINEPGLANREGVIQMAFNVFREGDGKGKEDGITAEGLHRMLRRSFPDIARSDADQIFADADVDGDGVITYGEFKRLASENEAYTQVFTQSFHEVAEKLVDTADKATEAKAVARNRGKAGGGKAGGGKAGSGKGGDE